MTVATLAAAAVHDSSSISVLVDLVMVLAGCVFLGLLMQKLGQSVLVGYLLAGVILGGPASLGVVEDVTSFSFMGEVGIALLLFTVGLDLPFDKVRKFGRMATIAGGIQVLLTTIAAGGIAHFGFDLGLSASFIVGIAVSLSSTAVVIQLLADRSETDSIHGLVATGMLIAQDVVVVLVLIMIPLLPGASGAGDVSFIGEFGLALGKLALLIIVVVAVERFLMRRLFHAGGTGTRELLAVASLTVSLGAIGACWALDLSPALGGFIAGIVMADATYAAQVRSEIAPIRMGLVAVFFAYVGMLADAEWMLHHPLQIIGVVVLLVAGKSLLTWLAARIAKVPPAAAILTAAGLAQLGEFSFAVLTAGDAAGLVSDDTFRLLVSVSLVTLLITPSLISATSRRVHAHQLALGEDVHLEEGLPEHAEGDHAIVVGAGPSGRSVVEALAGAGLAVTVIELNPRADTGDGEEDLPAGTRIIFGDATRPEILGRANLLTARIVVVTIPDPTAIRTIVAQTRQLAPDVPIVARGRYHRFVEDIHHAGADEVVDEEYHTGVQLAEVALRRLVQTGLVERRGDQDRRAPVGPMLEPPADPPAHTV
ncbi:MAG: Glutathione-regulated potassium-efflux system protein KefC [Thermoleophilia bacterium]|nr:Glutathione-regulated potassium-efflux system protein KefC [Thermoleophilia bacterium]